MSCRELLRIADTCRVSDAVQHRFNRRTTFSTHLARVLSVAVLIAAATLVARVPNVSANPLASLILFKRIEADPNKSYELTPECGPWLIMATSFAGEGADREAHDLVLELRSKFKLNAYVFSKHFDYTDRNLPGIGIRPNGAPVQMRYYNEAAFDEVAVMVGDFDAVDDPKLQKTLEKIKYARPECLDLTAKKTSTQRFAGLREFHRMITPDHAKKAKGPMRHAIAATNPLLPAEYFAPKGVDQFVVDMNRDVEHSLLDCPGKYSVRVATFRGNVVLDQKKIQEIESGRKFKSKLEEAAWKAHRLTELLRQKGVEAYEFHDRHESVVTVGSFDSLGTPMLDGRTNLVQGIVAIMNAFGPEKVAGRLAGTQQVGLQPRALDGIPFDVQPVPVEVPRRSIAADYARRSLWP